MPTLISLISDQTLPNVLFIKELQGQVDDYVFISTPAMQQREKAADVVAASGLPSGQCREVVIPDENDLQAMEDFLQEQFPDPDSCLVNLTCGNKLMFLACFNHFSKPGNTICYIPIGKNTVAELYPAQGKKAIGYRFSVREYLQAYGISYEPGKTDDFKERKFLGRILKEYKTSDYDPEKVAGMRNNEHKQFFTGTWFEQWAYYLLKDKYKLPDTHIECGIEINNFPQPDPNLNDNELDVVFTYNNELYVAEAKVGIGKGKINKLHLDQILFKLSALNKNFGLRSHAWIVTLADMSRETPKFFTGLERKMRILGIEGIADRQQILAGTGGLFMPDSKKTQA